MTSDRRTLHYSRLLRENSSRLATVHICMVAERSLLSSLQEAMASSHPGSPRQPTLAEEIDAIEKAEKVTAALQAVETRHDMASKSPKGHKPQMDPRKGVPKTPPRVSIKNTPSHIKIDEAGEAWTMEDDGQVQEEQEENNSGEEDGSQTQGSDGPRACARPADTLGEATQRLTKRPVVRSSEICCTLKIKNRHHRFGVPSPTQSRTHRKRKIGLPSTKWRNFRDSSASYASLSMP